MAEGMMGRRVTFQRQSQGGAGAIETATCQSITEASDDDDLPGGNVCIRSLLQPTSQGALFQAVFHDELDSWALKRSESPNTPWSETFPFVESPGPDLGGDVTSSMRLPSPAPLTGPLPCTHHTALSPWADYHDSPTLSISEFSTPQECFLNSRSGKNLTKGAPSLDWPSVTDTQQQELLWSGVLTHRQKTHLRLFSFIFSQQSNSTIAPTNTAPPQKIKKTHRRAKANSSATAGVRRETTNTPRRSQKLNRRSRERKHMETQVDAQETTTHMWTEHLGQEWEREGRPLTSDSLPL